MLLILGDKCPWELREIAKIDGMAGGAIL
jgi:hypothetical protein